MSAPQTPQTPTAPHAAPHVDHPRFSRAFNWLTSNGPGSGSSFDDLRRAFIGQAQGVVLEIGVGGGPNFAYYDPARVARVEATEPDATMLTFARKRAAQAKVPITLTQAPAEALPFADDSFDTAVMTLVLCSVRDPQRSLSELMRVLKPGGLLLMAEHVRSEHAAAAAIQSALVPVTARLASNCHWNRDTASAVRQAGFTDVRAEPIAYPTRGTRLVAGALLPLLRIEARAPSIT